ncbi:MAG TPA: EAL domain-containing protein [Thermomicrobiaceae bacterium]|nr:EAL domain-containing protein [Thermomicrobiaceae bacterium]
MTAASAVNWPAELGSTAVGADGGVLAKQEAGRLGAALFVLSGLVTVLTLVLPAPPGIDRPGVAGIGALATLVGFVNWWLPWERWPRWAALLDVPIAFSLIGAHNHFAAADPYRYGLFFIVAFMWIGLCYGRGMSLPFLPLFAVAYVAPLVTAGHVDPVAASSVAYTAPVCVLVAETVAWVANELRHTQRSLSDSGVRFQSLVQHASDLVTVIGADGVVQYVSPSVSRLTGYGPERLVGHSLFDLIHPEDVARAQAVLEESVRSGHAAPAVEVRFRSADGEWRFAESVITNLLDDPSVRAVVVNSRDTTERKRVEEQLAHQAFHDPLTDLPNRALLGDRLDHALARAHRSGTLVALLFLDLDNFKVVNDSLGHDVGDRLLIAVATRLQSCLGPADTALRFGGDEFAVLLEDLAGVDAAVQVAERISVALGDAFVVDGHELFTTACIGIALSQPGQDRPEDVLRNADVAMYRAKAGGANRYQVFDAAMYARARQRLALEQELRRAFLRDELRVYYQPVIDFASGKIVEIEALVRWAHPKRGLLGPSEFVPMAEETGLIVTLGQWVLREACRQVRAWQRQYPRYPPLAVSVNLSAHQFRCPTLIADVDRVLRETGLPPASLKFEITESVMMEDSDATVSILTGIKARGIMIAVDDFGTGYSSLSYLKRFPADALKIDQSFVGGLGINAEDHALVSAMVVAGKALHLQITVEGIETPTQADRVRELGCDRGQGFLFARPLDSHAIDALFSANHLGVSSAVVTRAADD